MKKNLTDLPMKKIRALLIVLIGGTISIASLYGFFLTERPPLAQAISDREWSSQSASIIGAMEDISIEAKAAFVFDIVENKVIFSRNENEKLPLASITKLMTAFVAKDKMGDSVVVTIKQDDIQEEGNSGLHEDERWRLVDLLGTMLVASSNDAAHAIATFVGSEGQNIYTGDSISARANFVEMMNNKAKDLGLMTMEFFNESGLDIIEQNRNGGYGSARDVARLFVLLQEKYPSLLDMTTHETAQIKSQDGIIHHLINTDGAIGDFPGLLASKTGYTISAGGNLAIIFDIGVGHPVVLVVLGSTYKGRFNDMQILVQAVLNSM